MTLHKSPRWALIQPYTVEYGKRASSAALHRPVTRMRYFLPWHTTEDTMPVAFRYATEYNTAHMYTVSGGVERPTLKHQTHSTACNRQRPLSTFGRVASPGDSRGL